MISYRERRAEELTASQGSQWKHRSVCASACASYFGVLDNARYLHNVDDIVRVLRNNGYSVRSRKSFIKKKTTVGRVRKQLVNLGSGDFLIRVEGHALVMRNDGTTGMDTAPRKRDARKITHIYMVEKANG